MKAEDYPLTFPMFRYLSQRVQHPQIEEFPDWMRSPSAQLVIRRTGFVDLAAVPIPLSNQGDRLANAISNAGPEIPLTELQRGQTAIFHPPAQKPSDARLTGR